MKRLLKVLGILLLLAIIGAAGLAVFVYRDLNTPTSHSRSDTYIDVPRGSSPYQILEKLQSQGVIRRTWPLWLYLRITGSAAHLKAGEYRFPTPISPMTVVRKLTEGEQRLGRFTVIEGWTRFDIAEAMVHIPELHLANTEQALALMDDTSSIEDLAPHAHNLEGYLFPDTYSFPPDANASQMLQGMVKRFRQEWKPDSKLKAESLGVTPNQIVTIASLIETEAKLKEERPVIASVIYNRMKRGMPLGIDSSVIYASKLAGTWRNDGHVYKSDLDRQSPYNTRLNPGLPPGPIGSAGASALNAALNPTKSDYLYYVRDPARNDGAHNFYTNPADFEKGVQALREWERQRDLRNNNQNSVTQ
jgi:UPF0755 protein